MPNVRGTVLHDLSHKRMYILYYRGSAHGGLPDGGARQHPGAAAAYRLTAAASPHAPLSESTYSPTSARHLTYSLVST